jgi:hypothetical protein
VTVEGSLTAPKFALNSMLLEPMNVALRSTLVVDNVIALLPVSGWAPTIVPPFK